MIKVILNEKLGGKASGDGQAQQDPACPPARSHRGVLIREPYYPTLIQDLGPPPFRGCPATGVEKRSHLDPGHLTTLPSKPLRKSSAAVVARYSSVET